MKQLILTFSILFTFTISFAQTPPQADLRMYDIVEGVSASRLETDIRKLADFGTRHTLSDTLSETRGIGAARRWIKSEFDKISADCGGCLEVFYHRTLAKGDEKTRIKNETFSIPPPSDGSAGPHSQLLKAPLKSFCSNLLTKQAMEPLTKSRKKNYDSLRYLCMAAKTANWKYQ